MNILIWGTGRKTDVLEGLIDLKDVKAFIDNDISKKTYMNKPVIQPDKILEMSFDAIIVATIHSEAISLQCNKIGIPQTKMIYLFNNVIKHDLNNDYDFVSSIIGKDKADFLKKQSHIIFETERPRNWTLPINATQIASSYYETDYVRIRIFELCVKEMKKRSIQGNVAELGVFRGEFAQYINMAFPEKKLYLFDTFSGFDEQEAESELKKNHANRTFIESYKNTSIDIVMQKMTTPDSVIIKQGLFPQSLDGLEDTFAFVSLDVDFSESIFEGLKYFYPRLNKGGYIFIHDYNSTLLGVEDAIDRFEKETGINLVKVPLCDKNGTLVITK